VAVRIAGRRRPATMQPRVPAQPVATRVTWPPTRQADLHGSTCGWCAQRGKTSTRVGGEGQRMCRALRLWVVVTLPEGLALTVSSVSAASAPLAAPGAPAAPAVTAAPAALAAAVHSQYPPNPQRLPCSLTSSTWTATGTPPSSYPMISMKAGRSTAASCSRAPIGAQVPLEECHSLA
jgi:hypothetical protein